MASTASTSRGAPLRTLMQQTHKNTRSFATSPITHAESSSSPSRSAASSSSSTSSNASFSGSGGGGRKGRPQRSAPLPPYPEWIAGQGKAYETAPTGKGPFWIASTPFPLNPTFNPSPPLSQQVRNLMWTLHSQDPETNSVRALSGRFGTAMERVTAVLRLKALEREHVQLGKPLQTPFQKHMERLLGSAQDIRSHPRESDTAQITKSVNFRGPIREEVAVGAESENAPSPIAEALAKETEERKIRMRSIPTGGPASRGPAPSHAIVETANQSRRSRPSLSVTDLSSRPSSYQGAGNAKRKGAKSGADKK